jgi:hypothetical protein
MSDHYQILLIIWSPSRKQSSQILATTTDTQTALLDYISSSAHESPHTNTLLAETRDVVNEKTASLTNDLARITLTSDQIYKEVSDHRLDIISQLRARDESLKEFIRIQSQRDCTELLASIRHELQTQLIRQGSLAEVSQTPSPDPARMENSVFEVDVQLGTLKLENNDERVPTGIKAAEGPVDLRRQKRWRCRCSTGRQMSVWNYGRFRFRIESQAIQSCPLHGKMGSWSYSITAQLIPWLKRILELTLGAYSGPDSWYIAPPLKLRAIVKRSESPIFQLFDRLIGSFLYKVDLSREMFLCRSTNKRISFDWGNENATLSLADLSHTIDGIIRSGVSAGSDADEYGSTLLFVSPYTLLLNASG